MNIHTVSIVFAWIILIGLTVMAIISFIKEPPHRYIKEALKDLEWENGAED